MIESSTGRLAGRDPTGRFTRGNKGGPGNPHARHVQELRRRFFAAVTEDEFLAVRQKLVDLALEGDVQAIRLYMERLMGKPEVFDLPELDAPERRPTTFILTGEAEYREVFQKQQAEIEQLSRRVEELQEGERSRW